MEQPIIVIDEEIFYSPTSLQRIFDVSESTIRKWHKDGKLPPRLEINGQIRYSSRDVKLLVDRQNPQRIQIESTTSETTELVNSL